MRNLKTLNFLIFFILQGFALHGQNPVPDTLNANDTANVLQDTIPSGSVQDTTFEIRAKQDNDIQTTIDYSADDSIRFDVVNNIIRLYGNANVNYGEIDLTAAFIQVNWSTNILTAYGTTDTTGRTVGRPFFRQADDEFQTDTIRYNFETEKGYISGVVTQEGEGFIHAEHGKKARDNFYFSNARYTTCNLADPHFYIKANQLKLIPGDKVVSGPFNLHIADVPTPLGFIFGYFPIPKQRSSGIIFPEFGENARYGFFLSRGGFYLALKDYAGIELLGDIYSNGSWAASLKTDYVKRYRYRGFISGSISRLRTGFSETEEFPTDFNMRWQHSTVSRGNGNFNANVNIASYSYFGRNSYNPTTIIQNNIYSNVSYTYRVPNTPVNFTLSGQTNQNTETEVTTITLPEANLSVNRVYPFRDLFAGRNWLDNISVGYTGNAKAVYKNIPTALARLRQEASRPGEVITVDTINVSPGTIDEMIERAEYGARHNIPIQTTLKAFRYFNLNPSIRYTEYWYPERLNYEWVETPDSVYLSENLERGFSRSSEFSFNTGLNFWIYGMARFKENSFINAIRHTVKPVFTYTYRPDFSNTDMFNSYQNVRVNQRGTTESLSRFSGFLYGAPAAGKRNSLTFNLDNTLEAKIRSSDTARQYKKISIIDRFGISGVSYNFAADEYKLSNIALYANTNILNQFTVNFRATLDPYVYRLDSMNGETVYQTRLNELAFRYRGNEGLRSTGGLGQLTTLDFSVSTTFNPAVFKRRKEISDEADASQLAFISQHPELYVDFNIPWNLSVNYYFRRSQIGFRDPNISQSIDIYGDINITENWKIGVQTGFDIVNKGFSPTSIKIYRNLHCWQMNLNIVPFGNRQSYFFTISAKSSILQDLKLSKRSNTYTNSPIPY